MIVLSDSKYKNSPREICPSASVSTRGRDILRTPSTTTGTLISRDQQRSAEICRDHKHQQRWVERSASSDVLQHTDLTDLSLSRVLLLLSVLLRDRLRPGPRCQSSLSSRRMLAILRPIHPPARETILRQNAGPMSGQSSIMGREGRGGTKIVVKYDG